MHCRKILLTPRCSPRAREFSFLYDVRLRSYGASRLRNFRINFGLLSNTKHLKRTFRWSATAQGLHRSTTITIFPCGSRRSKGVRSGTGGYLRLLVWGAARAGDPHTCPNFRLRQMVISILHRPTECYCTARQIWTKDVWKRAILRTDVVSPSRKITPKPHFGGPFNAKPITQRVLRKSHVNGATNLKL